MRNHTKVAWKIALIRAVYFLFWASVLAIPVYGPFAGGLEGRVWPVTSHLVLQGLRHDGNGTSISFAFDKLRQCEFVGASATKWNNYVPMYPERSGRLTTRGLGTQQSDWWHIGVLGLDGVSIFLIHRCSPLWLTITKVL